MLRRGPAALNPLFDNTFEVHGMVQQPAKADRRIVVGVDGSACSKTALLWAMTQAGLVGATVEAIGVQHPSGPVVVIPPDPTPDAR